MFKHRPWSSLLLALPLLCGCPTEQQPAPPADPAPAKPTDAGSETPPGVAALFLAERPADAQPLLAVKQKSKVGDEVVFEAKVGGRAEPFVGKRAIVTVMDPGVKACSVGEEGCCETPWDYCCETPQDILAKSGTVRMVDGAGKPLAEGLQGQRGLAGLKTVVVRGKVAETTAEGVFVVDASGVWVAP